MPKKKAKKKAQAGRALMRQMFTALANHVAELEKKLAGLDLEYRQHRHRYGFTSLPRMGQDE